MTKEQMRIVVAEIVGGKWYEWKDSPGCGISFEMPPYTAGSNQIECKRPDNWINSYYYNRHTYPNYPEDLNACHKAWLTLDRKQRITHSHILRVVVIKAGGHATSLNEDIVACVENATATQRTEAFIRLHGRWID